MPDKGKELSPKENCCGGLEELKSQVAEYVKVPRVANVEIISALHVSDWCSVEGTCDVEIKSSHVSC